MKPASQDLGENTKILEPEWHLVKTKPRSEYLASASLGQNGYQVFLPRVVSPKPRKGKIDAPFFPGYLFVREQIEEGRNRPPVNASAGVVGKVEFEGVVPAVPNNVIAALQNRIHSINNNGGFWKRYEKGEKVRVAWGAIDNLSEIIEEPVSPESRVHVLLEFMGRLLPVHVPWSSIHTIQRDPKLIPNKERWQRRTRGKRRWIRGFNPI